MLSVVYLKKKSTKKEEASQKFLKAMKHKCDRLLNESSNEIWLGIEWENEYVEILRQNMHSNKKYRSF